MRPVEPRAVIGIGADFGFRSDSSAICVVQKLDGVYHVAELLELMPARGAPLQPSIVVGRFAEIVKRHHASTLIADAHYAESIREHLQEHRLHLERAPEGQEGKAKTYVRARALINEGLLRIPRHARLIGQLKAIVFKPTPGGGISISSPRRGAGGHGDLVSALVLALWSAHRRGESEYVSPVDVAVSSLRSNLAAWCGGGETTYESRPLDPALEPDPSRGTYEWGGWQ